MAKNDRGNQGGGNTNQGGVSKPRIQENGAGAGATKGSRSEDRPVNPKK